MGQRLNLEIEKGGVTLANCYYHWSAYTTSALSKALQVVEGYNELLSQNYPDQVLAVKLMERTNYNDILTDKVKYAGLDETEDYQYMSTKYPEYTFNQAVDRNAGIISVTVDHMNTTRNWEEGRTVINLDKKIVDNSGLLFVYTKEEFIEMYDEELDWDDLPVCPCNELSEIPFYKVGEILDYLSDNGGYYRNEDGTLIYRLIE